MAANQKEEKRGRELREWFNSSVEWIMQQGLFRSKAALARHLDIPKSTISSLATGTTDIGVSRDVEHKMRNYLRTISDQVHETAPSYVKAVSKLENGELGAIHLIPVYVIKATADRVEFQKSSQQIAMPNVSFSDRIMAVKMWGDFLAPQYTMEDHIAIQQLKDTSIIQYGMPHIIRTQEQFIPRILMPGEGDTYLLKSTNEKLFPDLVIPKDKVVDLYIIIDKASPPGQ